MVGYLPSMALGSVSITVRPGTDNHLDEGFLLVVVSFPRETAKRDEA